MSVMDLNAAIAPRCAVRKCRKQTGPPERGPRKKLLRPRFSPEKSALDRIDLDAGVPLPVPGLLLVGLLGPELLDVELLAEDHRLDDLAGDRRARDIGGADRRRAVSLADQKDLAQIDLGTNLGLALFDQVDQDDVALGDLALGTRVFDNRVHGICSEQGRDGRPPVRPGKPAESNGKGPAPECGPSIEADLGNQPTYEQPIAKAFRKHWKSLAFRAGLPVD